MAGRLAKIMKSYNFCYPSSMCHLASHHLVRPDLAKSFSSQNLTLKFGKVWNLLLLGKFSLF